MKKVLAILIPALLAAGAANAAEIYNKDGSKLNLYGKFDAEHYFSSDDSQNGDATYARFGIKAETQINQSLIGYGRWEYNIKSDNAEGGSGDSHNSYSRLAYAGLKHDIAGSFDYGRNYGVIYDIGGWTDVLPEFGGDTVTLADNFMTQRANGLATYRNTDFFGLVDGLNFAVQYQGKNDSSNCTEGCTQNGRNKISKQNGDGWGISSTYDLGMGLSLGAAYTSSDRTLQQQKAGDSKINNTAGGDKADAWTAGVKYEDYGIYLAAMYAETRNMTPFGDSDGIANKAQNYELVAQYTFDFGLQPSLAYLQSKAKDLNNTNGRYDDSQDIGRYVDVGLTQFFNKNISAFVDYKINLLDNNAFTAANGISTDNIVATGFVYQF
ncbi:MAG: porin OmpC [Enterobacteriaceae bacterium]|jgi:outer membrane protein N|nr:porin OmpC [Enterobacteriaceae bacterium]